MIVPISASQVARITGLSHGAEMINEIKENMYKYFNEFKDNTKK
jgi:hypothetical protein